MLRNALYTLVLSDRLAYGQLPTSSVTGNVVDPQGLPIAGAHVTVTNEGTKVASEVVTTSLGEFAVSGLDPASYKRDRQSARF